MNTKSRNKRQAREQTEVDRAVREINGMIDDFTMPINTYADAVKYLKLLFTNGMRLVKYREQIECIKSTDDETDQAKAEVINNIDAVIDNVLENAEKVFKAIKEYKNK